MRTIDLKNEILSEIGQRLEKAEEEQEELLIEVVPARTESREQWEEHVKRKDGTEHRPKGPGLATKFIFRPWQDKEV